MFKFMKQGISLAAAVSAAGSCIPVYAAGIQPHMAETAEDAGTGTSITIESPADGHRYKVYQVFKGKLSSDGTRLSNLKYGANYPGREGMTLADELAQLEAEDADAKAFAEAVKGFLTGEPAAVLSKESPTAELESGYYLVMDESDGAAGDSLSDYIVTAAGNVSIKPKSVGVPEFDKSIDDGKDENGGDNGDSGNGEGETEPDTEEPSEPPIEESEEDDISPNTANMDWSYTLDDENDIITLVYYKGTDEHVKVYSKYKVDGSDKIYTTRLSDNHRTVPSGYMFAGKRNLKSVVFSNFLNTSETKSMASMFNQCAKLESVDFGTGFDTSNVLHMKSMFSGCSSLLKLDLSRFDTGNAGILQDMFYNCLSLESIDFGAGFSLQNATSLLRMFYNCSSLKTLDVSNFYTSNVKTMTGMFSGCSSLQSLDLTNFDTSSVTDMSSMFSNCTNITEIRVLSEKWVTNQATISNMFTGCGVSEVTYTTETASAFSSILPETSASGLTEENTAPEEYIEIENDDTSVEYGIGDSIPYKLTATMPESITAYNKYVLAFHDKLSAGLDYDRDSLKVFAGDTEIPAEHYTVTYSEDGRSMTVSIADVKAAPWNAVPGTQIIVKYSAILNENAQAGNTNEAFLEYSNDPKGDGTGTTGPGVPDIVTVYTFELRFDKVDKNGNALEGAGFTLYKKNDAGEFVPAGDEIKGLTRFSFKGLAAGEYKLVETTTPDGYNTMEDLYFNIVAEEAESGGETVKRISIEAPDGSPLSGWTAIGADKAFESDIANYTGSTLPETGGVGTYLLYAAGVAVVITAGTVIAARKKADEE